MGKLIRLSPSWSLMILCRGAVRQPLEGKKAELERDALRGKGELQEKMKKIKDLRQQLKQTSSKLRLR